MRDREIERLTEVFKDAILHAPIPDVNPNLIRTVESQARECALRVVGEGRGEPVTGAYFESWCDDCEVTILTDRADEVNAFNRDHEHGAVL